MKKTKIKPKPQIKEKPDNKKILNKIILSLLFIAIIVTVIIIFKIKPSQNFDTSTTVSTLDTQYIIVKNKEGNKEFKLPIRPAMAKSLGFPATPVTPTMELQQKVSITTTTNTQEQKKDYSYLFKPVKSKEEIYRIDIDEAKFLFDSGKALFIDARSISEYDEAHIKGAIPIPLNLLMENIEKYKDKLKNKILVSYCHGIGCHLSDRVAYQLYDSGYRNICIFFSGWPKWVEHKYPITQKNNKVMSQ